ncbi:MULTISPECIES: NnrU family protein [unclassified Methylobacterium]|uniref:NnrU family protein n=1 Tax=unclassified Methylobacterium TaxID=2615210 RepID=UPI0036F621E3
MLVLILGLVLFLGTHAFSMARGPRAAVIDRYGEGRFKLGYTLLSALGLALTVYGYGLYRQEGMIPVWSPPLWTRHLAVLLTLFAFISLAATYLPGQIRTRLKHPMLLAVKIWATAHLLANGDLGSILLFGSFLAWAVAARISAKRRSRTLTAGQVAQQHGGQAAPAGWRNDAIAVVVGVVAWFVFGKYLHPLLIGVAAWPGQA